MSFPEKPECNPNTLHHGLANLNFHSMLESGVCSGGLDWPMLQFSSLIESRKWL